MSDSETQVCANVFSALTDASLNRSIAQTYVLQTAGFDARFPNTNQSRHCVSSESASST